MDPKWISEAQLMAISMSMGQSPLLSIPSFIELVERFKARLVAKRFTQTYGIDCPKTFASVAKMNSIRVILSCAANLDWKLEQLDVKNVFLHGDLEEEVYIEIPSGFTCKATEGKSKYILDLLEETGMLGCKPADTPIETNHQLKNDVGEKVDKERYQRLVGRSKKQAIVARSSVEVEYRVMAQGVCEVLWLKGIMCDLGIIEDGPSQLYCDNKASINITHNPVQHDWTKHIEIDQHFIKEKLVDGEICISFVISGDKLVDILTKGLSSKMFGSIISKMGMKDIYTPS
ncbi:uncharacterized protein LOC119987869 [Tripterygium wilfordii]|uniref:uncharacterized protein LOC119987869 n=1 Tax=Tripterygium wilfordii TaxID=458696 RepID=UPI0018F84A5F|nr:uncharacterized protein LOC119987869 [Tripterygium wilfordii]